MKTSVVVGAPWDEDGVAVGGDVPFKIPVPLEFRVKALLNDGRVAPANASTAENLLENLRYKSGSYSLELQTNLDDEWRY